MEKIINYQGISLILSITDLSKSEKPETGFCGEIKHLDGGYTDGETIGELEAHIEEVLGMYELEEIKEASEKQRQNKTVVVQAKLHPCNHAVGFCSGRCEVEKTPGHIHSIGVDIGGGGTYSDDSSIVVIDTVTMEQVYQQNLIIDPDGSFRLVESIKCMEIQGSVEV